MKKQLKEDLQKLFNEIETIRKGQFAILEDLQELSKKAGKPMWCSWNACYEQLKNNNEKIDDGTTATYAIRALNLYEEYCRLEGKIELLYQLGDILAKNEFWK